MATHTWDAVEHNSLDPKSDQNRIYEYAPSLDLQLTRNALETSSQHARAANEHEEDLLWVSELLPSCPPQ